MKLSPSSILTVSEVAEYLRVNQRTIYRLAVDRKLPAFKVGTTWRFKLADIEGWIAAQSSIKDAAIGASDLAKSRGA